MTRHSAEAMPEVKLEREDVGIKLRKIIKSATSEKRVIISIISSNGVNSVPYKRPQGSQKSRRRPVKIENAVSEECSEEDDENGIKHDLGNVMEIVT